MSKCLVCGAELKDTDVICPSCGIETKEEAAAVVAKQEKLKNDNTNTVANEISSSVKPEKTKEKSIFHFIGLGVGVFAIVVGIYILCTAEADLSYASFGGDFYTYTYSGIRAVERAIYFASKAIGWLITIVGGISVSYFGTKIM